MWTSRKCPCSYGFDYEICSCGYDKLWEQRNLDLATVPEKENNE